MTRDQNCNDALCGNDNNGNGRCNGGLFRNNFGTVRYGTVM